MARKTAPETTRTDSSKVGKASPVTDSVTAAEIAIKMPQAGKAVPATPSARQEYPEVKAAIERGLADVAAGRVHRMSFAEYADALAED